MLGMPKTALPESPEELWDAELSAKLRAHDQRVTTQRLLIHRALRGLDRHVNAEELLDAVSPNLPNVSLPTIYSTLDLFDKLGIVQRVSTGAGAARFDPRTDEHHHLLCRRCGHVEDLDRDLDLSPALAAAGRSGFAAEDARVVIRGLCSDCAA